jgi:hypothetical protein
MLVGFFLLTELSAQHNVKDTLTCITVAEHGMNFGDKVAQFPGLIKEWNNYIKQNLRFPKKSKKNKKEGMLVWWIFR